MINKKYFPFFILLKQILDFEIRDVLGAMSGMYAGSGALSIISQLIINRI